MKTAKEMFEELGFKQTFCINQQWSEHAQVKYECIAYDNCVKREIYFIENGFYAQLFQDLDGKGLKVIGGCIVTKGMLKAITKQMEELHWIGEE